MRMVGMKVVGRAVQRAVQRVDSKVVSMVRHWDDRLAATRVGSSGEIQVVLTGERRVDLRVDRSAAASD